jgi:hypothetical protein
VAGENKSKGPYRRTSVVINSERLRKFDSIISTLGVNRTTAYNILAEWVIQQRGLPAIKLPDTNTNVLGNPVLDPIPTKEP